jgi:hypothetical protein
MSGDEDQRDLIAHIRANLPNTPGTADSGNVSPLSATLAAGDISRQLCGLAGELTLDPGMAEVVIVVISTPRSPVPKLRVLGRRCGRAEVDGLLLQAAVRGNGG